jgi:hypothetical protein
MKNSKVCLTQALLPTKRLVAGLLETHLFDMWRANNRTYHPVTLLFESQACEDCFVIRFYSHNQSTALVGLVVFLVILGITSVVVLDKPKLQFASFKVSQILAVSLSISSVATAVANRLIFRKYRSTVPSSKKVTTIEGGIDDVVVKDPTAYIFASWWEVSLFLAYLAAISWSVTLIVGKAVGCMGSDTLNDTIESHKCVTTLQFDGVLIAPMILQGLVYPVRWCLHVPLTLATIIVLFGIRFLPQITLSVTESKFVMTTAFVFSVPLVLSAVIRFQRERGFRLLLLTELRLEEALRQMSVLKARHESLLTPWVPLPVEEQVKLLRSSQHHKCHLWGLSTQTLVGVIQFRSFGSWVARAGACESARALFRLVDTADKHYELLSSLSVSLLKCHVDGDRYLLVCPEAADGGLLIVMAHLACQEFAKDSLTEQRDQPLVEGGIASGVLGVAAIAASGTLTPVGPAMERLNALFLFRSTTSTSALLNEKPIYVTVASNVLDIVPRVPVDERTVETLGMHARNGNDDKTTSSTTTTASESSSEGIGDTKTVCPLSVVSLGAHRRMLEMFDDSPQDLMPFEVRLESTAAAAAAASSSFDEGPLTQLTVPSMNTPRTNSSACSSRSFHSGTTQSRGNVTQKAFVQPGLPPKSWEGGPLDDHQQDHPATTPNPLLPPRSEAGDADQQILRFPAERSNKGSAVTHLTTPAAPPKKRNLASVRRFAVLAIETFVDPLVECRYQLYAHQGVPTLDLCVASVAALIMGLFLALLGVVYDTTALNVPGPMTCSLTAIAFGVVLVLASAAHAKHCVHSGVVLVVHEVFFFCFYSLVVGAVYTSQPYTSPLGDTQPVWHFMLLTINFVRPRAHGLAPHITLECLGCTAFLVLAFVYPHHSPFMRFLNVVCAAVIGVAAISIHSLMDCDHRQTFATEVSLEDLRVNRTHTSDEITKLLETTQANNPAAIFAARAQRSRKSRRTNQQLMVSESPLLLANVDPSTSTTIASRATDSAVLLVDFVSPSRDVVTTEELRDSVLKVKAFVEAVDAIIATHFCGTLRIAKATPSSILILSNASVVGKDLSGAAPLTRSSAEIPLLELSSDVVWRISHEYQMVSRAVIDSGMMVGVLLGTSSMSFEFTGPVIKRTQSLVRASPWGHVFVTQRVLRYCGVPTSTTLTISTATGLHGVIEGDCWLPWRVSSSVVQMGALVQKN